MTLRLLFGTAVLVLACAARAEDWAALETTADGSLIEIDTESAARHDDIASAWVRTTFTKADGYLAGERFTRAVVWYEANCARRVVAVRRAMLFATATSTLPISDVTDAAPRPQPVAPETERLFVALCKARP